MSEQEIKDLQIANRELEQENARLREENIKYSGSIAAEQMKNAKLTEALEDIRKTCRRWDNGAKTAIIRLAEQALTP